MMLTGIPVTFEYKGVEYKGHLSQVMGAGSTANFHLTVNGFHWGQLVNIAGDPGFAGGLHAVEPGWRFLSNQFPDLNEQAEFFGYVVAAWVDAHTEI